MRSLLLSLAVCLFLLLPITALSQIPNGDFESWTGAFPDHWASGNVTKSTMAHGGLYSAQGTNAILFPGTPALPGVLQSGSKFPVTQPYSMFTGYYQYMPVSTDVFFVSILMYSGSATIATAFQRLSQATGWTQFFIPISYPTGGTPDSAAISISIIDTSGSGIHANSTFYIDDLSLSTTSAVSERIGSVPDRVLLGQNYPNPFNPTTTISFSLPSELSVTITVFNALGQLIATPIDHEQRAAGMYAIPLDMSRQPSGTYFCRLQAGFALQTRTMVLVK
jgi:hypothetical protein